MKHKCDICQQTSAVAEQFEGAFTEQVKAILEGDHVLERSILDYAAREDRDPCILAALFMAKRYLLEKQEAVMQSFQIVPRSRA